MPSAEADPLLEAAGRVVDGAEVDWTALEREIPDERAAIAALRRLAALGAATAVARGDSRGTGGVEKPMAWRWGHLEVRERLGEGSFGEVWRAFDPILQREVALKLRRVDAAESGSDAHVFLDEARHLAGVRHPNVLGVHGADVHANRVGLWTDLVSGRTLEEILVEDGPLPPRRVIDIGAALADALDAVHRNDLVHGDVKAANVMLEDERERVVLMDFGAAAPKARAGRFGSPLSMAPELLAGEAPTSKCDVYSVGVLLYRLLSGRYPVEAEELQGLVAGHRGHPAEHRTHRLAAPRSVRLLISRLLATDPASRPDAGVAVERIRHIQDAPRRRRRRLAVAAVVASLAAGTVLASLGTLQARREARRAEAVRDFVVDLFAGVDPDATRGRTVPAKELLDRGAERLETELATQPELRAEMLGVVGRLYLKLGLYPQARPLLEEALAVRRKRSGTPVAALADSEGDLASVLFEQGEYEEAERLAREALAGRRAEAGRHPAALSASLADLGAVLSTRGRAEEAEAAYREAIAIVRRLGDRTALAAHLSGFGTALSRAARYDEARQALEESLAIRRAVLGTKHTQVATTLLGLGADLMELGRFAEAESRFREALDMRRELLGDGHPYVADAYSTLGDLLQRTGRLEEAEAAHRKALDIFRTALGDTHPDVANSLNHIGVVQYFEARYAEAAATFEQVLPLWRAVYGPHHRNVFAVLNNLGAARREAGDYPGAEKVLRETLALRREAFGEDHPDVAQSLNNLALLLSKMGQDSEAEASFRQAIAIWRRTLGDGHPNLAYGLVDLGTFLANRRRYSEAEPLLHEGLTIRVAELDPDAPLLASTRLHLAEALIGLGRAGEARALLEAALPVLVEQWGEDEEITKEARRAMTRARSAAAAE